MDQTAKGCYMSLMEVLAIVLTVMAVQLLLSLGQSKELLW